MPAAQCRTKSGRRGIPTTPACSGVMPGPPAPPRAVAKQKPEEIKIKVQRRRQLPPPDISAASTGGSASPGGSSTTRPPRMRARRSCAAEAVAAGFRPSRERTAPPGSRRPIVPRIACRIPSSVPSRILRPFFTISTFEQTSSSRCSRCELMMIAAPSRARRKIESFIRRMPSGSRPVSGSSKKITSASAAARTRSPASASSRATVPPAICPPCRQSPVPPAAAAPAPHDSPPGKCRAVNARCCSTVR